jgi:hypothetical protein
MFKRSIAVATIASFLTVGTQSAFAAPDAADAARSTATVPAEMTTSQSGMQSAMSTAASTGRAHRVARIPGTFALSSTDPRSSDVRNEDRVQLPPLSGDGGG